ncbi:MAG: RNA helicase [Clostridia bacterium]|nr:RNA helicase [Clostridia bacterium]
MAKPIDSGNAKRLADQHSTLLKNMIDSVVVAEGYKKEVESAANEMVALGAMRLLKNAPVEELNRDKRGIKTKLLRDNGYNTLADVYRVKASQLSKISGISPESARLIKKVVNEYATTASKQVKITISADNRNARSDKLVLALYKYKYSLAPMKACKKRIVNNKGNIESDCLALAPAMGGLKWMFSSREKKDNAVAAYGRLEALRNGEYFSQSEADLKTLDAIRKTIANQAWEDFIKDPVSYSTALERINPVFVGGDDTVYGLPEDLAHEIQLEPLHLNGLSCTLRRYQEWGAKYILHQKQVLLGDEMGLGKTVQAIAAMVSLRNDGGTHFAVVCPASVITNWCREIKKHSDLPVIKVHGSDKEDAIEEWRANGGVAVTTYETTGFFKLDDRFKYTMLAVDEAHYIKNPEAKRTANTVRLARHAERMLFMTGTALENRVEEMISLIRVLRSDIATQVEGMAFMSSAPQFRENVAPVYYRRKRDDVLTELPELIENREWCALLPEEEDIYEQAVLDGDYTAVRRVSWNVPDLNNSSKALRLKEIVEEAEEEGRKIIVFSFYLETIRVIREFLGDRCLEPINGSIPPQRRQEIIDEFDKAPAGSVLVAQIQSGGTGLNIQSASVVILCEPQFKPSIENQAISRAYRMGQARSVLVYRLLGDETVDERVTELLEKKQAIFNAFADQSVVGQESLELDRDSFSGIVDKEKERIEKKRGINTDNSESISDETHIVSSEELEKAVMPETPETPEAPEAPKAPEAPEVPETPEISETPETSEAPETPEVPETSVEPEAPTEPNEPEIQPE